MMKVHCFYFIIEAVSQSDIFIFQVRICCSSSVSVISYIIILQNMCIVGVMMSYVVALSFIRGGVINVVW